MNLHAFYNLDNVGDILLVRLGEGTTFKYEKHDDLVILKNIKDEVIGYNILNASKYFDDLNQGLVKLNETLVNQINDLLKKYDQEEVVGDFTPRFVVGKVESLELHPDSDHLHVCQVNLGSETTQIVCGAPNVATGQLVVVATIGAVMPSGLIIKPSKLRKVDSNGMLCSARELNLENAPQIRGILVLDENKYQVGESFF